MECFNSYLYLYYINQGVNPSAITVNLNRVPSIIKEGQSYIELPKELWDKTKQIEGRKRAILFRSYQPNTSYAS